MLGLELLIGGLLWELSELIACIVFIANLLTMCLPNHSSNKYVQKVYNFLNRLSLNVYRNTNKLHDAIDDEVSAAASAYKRKRVGGAKP